MSRRSENLTGNDQRKTYLLKVASHILSLNLTEERLPNVAALNNFCLSDVSILVISRLDQKGHVDLSNELNNNQTAILRAIFYKIKNIPLGLEDYKTNVCVLSMHKNAGETLLGTLKQVFSKVLISQSSEPVQEARVANLMGELEESLLLKINEGENSFGGKDEAISGGGGSGIVCSLSSEIELWKLRAKRGSDQAQNYSDALEPLSEHLEDFEGTDLALDELYSAIDAAEQSVDNLWNLAVDEPYPQQRMKQLLNCIGQSICSAIVKRVSLEEYFHSSELSRTAISLTQQWLDTVDLLTSRSWPQNGLHPWEGSPHRMEQLERFHKRLDEVIKLKIFINLKVYSLVTLGEQIVRLLDKNNSKQEKSLHDQIQKAIDNAMKNTNPFEFGPHTEQQWKSSLLATEKALGPYIELLLPTLREQILQTGGGNIEGIEDERELIIDELHRFRHFLGRKPVKDKLQAERQTLFARLNEEINSQQRNFERLLNSSNLPTGRFLTEIASKIYALRSQRSQVDKLLKAGAAFFEDLPNYGRFEQTLKELLENLIIAEQEQFDAWCRDMITHIIVDGQNGGEGNDGDSISLQTTGRLMILERSKGILTVSFSDRLARLLREVSQLQSMGFKIPTKIMVCTQQGERFYEYGVAHFYNTIEKQMLPCQQAMLLDEALAFERLVVPSSKASDSRQQKTAINLTWESPEKLKGYIERLREAALQLTSHNRRLRKAHTEIIQLILELGETDLLREEEKWNANMLLIRQKFLEEQNFIAVKANMNTWANHLNKQIFKILHLKFCWALADLQGQMPILYAQLIFRDQKLQLRPPLEELRQSFYGALHKLLGIPQRMRGVQNTENESVLFAGIISREAKRFQSLYERSEKIFLRLRKIDREFDEWIALTQINLEELLEQHLHQAIDWERQFRILRLKQRELDKIPNEICIECIHVSTNGVRLLANDLLRRMHDALCWTLKHSIRTELTLLDQQLTQGIERLSALPQSMEEVSEACTAQLTLARSISTFRNKLNVVEEKDQVLRSLFGSEQGLPDNVKQTREQFSIFLNLLETHELMMRDQVKTMKGNVGASIKTLGEELEKLHSLWNQFKPRSEIFTSQDDRMTLIRAVEFIREKRQEFDKLFEKIEKVRIDCEQFDIEQAEWPLLDELKTDLENYESNYLLYEDFSNALQPLSDQEWILFRSKTFLFDEFLQQWLDKLKSVQTSNVAVRLQKDIEQMKEFSINLKYCRGDIFSADHWLEMFRLLGLPKGTSLEKLKFGNLLNSQNKLNTNLDKLKELNARAHGEVSIREAIQELEMWAAQAEFTLTDYRHASGVSLKIVKEWKPVLNQVRDNQALISSLRNSSYYSQFSEQIGIWERKIFDLELYLHNLTEIQRKWVYLEPIFGRGSLPSEATRFNRIDAEFRIIINDISRDNRIISLCSSNNSTTLGRTLEQLVDQLNRCQRALNDFLEEKRGAFPRFYFLGDDDLLEIVGQSTNPTVIQSHLKKLFQGKLKYFFKFIFKGINRVAFDTQLQNIKAMISSEGEIVQLIKPVQIVPKVELWLEALSNEMRNTLQRLVIDCLHERSLDSSRYPSQVLCLSEQIRFCSDVEKCLSTVGGNPNENLNSYRRQLIKQLEHLSNSSTDEPLEQLKLKALVLDLIHHISILDQLINAENNQSIVCWTWRRQLRFYLVSGLVIVRHADFEFSYSYEYQGNAQKLVNTPLTDKCYLTLTHALAMGLGGNPYGPAGTGKTESVKALAGLLGRQVLVFNCDEGIDVNAISRIFVGLVQCGAWGCFDEFNRLTKGVLSAVSSQVQIIQEAVRIKANTCQIGDHLSVPVNTNSAIFVTLNPVGKGYGGRQRLPDNLKQLFRPVAMSVPDNELIAETLLFAEGYSQAKSLARKLNTTFTLANAMLSNQQHYDWGLRALKTVLKGCSDLINKRRQEIKTLKQQKQQQQQTLKLTLEEEKEFVVQNLHLNTISKLTFEDSKRFKILLEDIFTGVPNKTMQFDELRPHLENSAKNMQITLSKIQIHKIFELYEQLRQRVGVIIVGPPGTGKSTLWHLLQGALSSSGFQMIDVYKMNPKSMPRSRLLGHLEPDTREWTDGTLSQASREATKDVAKPAWIVCDGDVDPEWIEALNSVLDDNKLLTLPSGERIQFGPNVNFLFECVDLSYASPATISRVGMILLSKEDLPLKAVIDRFIVKYGNSLPSQLPDWINSHLIPAVEWTFEHLNRDFTCSQVAIVLNALSLIRHAQTLNQFLVCILRALFPYIEIDVRQEFAERIVFNGISLPDSKNVINIFAEPRTDILMTYSRDDGNIITTSSKLNIVMSPRMQSARETLLKWLNIGETTSKNINKLNESELTSFYPKFENILLLGPDGSGKECLLKSCFEEVGGILQKTCLVTMHCGGQSNALHIEQLLLEHCVQISNTSSGSNGRILKPKEHERLLLHLKSPNLSFTDIYGTSQLISFLEQALDYNGFYDKNLEWIGLENIQIILNVSTASGAERFPLPERFASKLRVLFLDSPDENELLSICSANLIPFFETKNNLRIEQIVLSITTTFNKLIKILTPNEHFHYVFNTNDLFNWVYNLQRYELDEADTNQINQCIHFEALRIFSDRLINIEHRLLVQTILNEYFPLHERLVMFSPTIEILTKEQQKWGKKMQKINKLDYSLQIQKAINRLKVDNDEIVNLPISDVFLDICLSMERILTSSKGGSILLAGQAGIGIRSIIDIISQIHQMKLCILRVSSSYSLRQFNQDLKDAIQIACIDDEQVILVIEDYQLLDEAFLQHINSLIASGNVPGLYNNQQEFDSILARLRDSAMDEGFGSTGSLHDYFSFKVQKNLHLIMIMNNGHPKFATRILSNPSLYKKCNIIWQPNLSSESLQQIAELSLSQKQNDLNKNNNNYSPPNWLLQLFVQLFHLSPIECQTPQRFLIFVENYYQLLSTKKAAIEKRLNSLRGGVTKLTETKTSVAKLQKKAAKKSKQLAEKQSEADSALNEITKSMTNANEQKADMEELKNATEAENLKIEEQKKLIEQQLSEVEPLLKEAREAVGSIKSESLSEIRSLRAPPEAIRDILQAVLLFMGILDVSWEAMRKFLAKNGVKEEIINFDAKRISSDTAKKVGALIKSKSASFDPKNAKRASAAAAPLAAWVTANLQYALIVEKIAPLEQKKTSLERNLNAAEKQMAQLSKGLKTVDRKVESLKSNFEIYMKEATEIKIELEKEQKTLIIASTLIERLGNEYIRWQQQSKQLENELETIENCCIISAAFLTFLGASTEEIRNSTIQNWKLQFTQLPEGFDILRFLTTESEQLNWKQKGIPSNKLSLENGAILFYSKQIPFIIDPSGIIAQFLFKYFNEINNKNNEGGGVQLLVANQNDLITQIELGVRFGKTLIVDELDNDIEPSLVPLLRREFKSSGGTRLVIQLGDKLVDYNNKFRLFLCTRNEHNRLGEHIRGSLTEVNFSVTHSGLASQLLGIAIQIEQPELEKNSAQLSSQMENLNIQLDQIEQILLEELTKSEGSLLENTSLLESLNQSKEKAEKVAKGIIESKRLRAEIDSKREAFRPFSERCAQLYFAIRPLNIIKSCYQYSVNDCISLFKKCFDSNKNDGRPNTSEEGGGKNHLERIYRRLRHRLFEYISRSLFKEDRLTFAMQYIHEAVSGNGGGGNLFSSKEWELFTGILQQQLPSSSVGDIEAREINQINWLLDDKEKRLAIELIKIHLPSLFQQMQINDQQAWAGFMKSTECENAYPPGVNSRLTDFQRVLILQALRPDRLHAGINRFASKVLGIESLSAPHLDFISIHKEEPSTRPILLLVSPGSSADPNAELLECAKQQQRKFHQMAFGQPGTEAAVLQLLRQCLKDGDWLCLNNAHLSTPSLLGKLLVEISSILGNNKQNIGNFRLWLTAEPEDNLPSVFLQTCVKATYETPPGIRQNLEQNYINQEIEHIQMTKSSLSHLKANFILHWLHAVLQERRNFIPQAWLKFYEFSGADLRVAKTSLDTLFINNSSNTDPSIYWERFRGLMLNSLYGGRIEAELDNRILLAFLLDLFNASIIEANDKNIELAPGLKMPSFGKYSEYIRWVETTLPIVDRAELLYLPRNIMLSWDLSQSSNVVSKLRLLLTSTLETQRFQTITGGGQPAKSSRQQLADSLNPLLGLWKRLNQQNPGLLQAAAEQKNQRPISAGQENKEISQTFSRRIGDDPLAEILHLELIFALKLMQFIHTSLSALSRAIKGTQLPEKRIVEMAQELMHFQVPSAWDSLWNGPNVPSQYLEMLILKAKSTQLMLSSARSNQLLSSRVNLAQLLRPGTLLNAFRQYSSRKLNISMDELKLSTVWQYEQNNLLQPKDNTPTLTLSNLRIQGAMFDGKELKQVNANNPPFTEVPALKIFWTKEDVGEQSQHKEKQQLLLPLFSDVDRNEIILKLYVPCPTSMHNSWIMAGVAFFLSQN